MLFFSFWFIVYIYRHYETLLKYKLVDLQDIYYKAELIDHIEQTCNNNFTCLWLLMPFIFVAKKKIINILAGIINFLCCFPTIFSKSVFMKICNFSTSNGIISSNISAKAFITLAITYLWYFLCRLLINKYC